MKDLLADFNERKEEIESYYNFLMKISGDEYELNNVNTNQKETIDDRVVKILKANIFILLYNLIEWTTDNSVDYICREISKQNLKYGEFIKEVKMQWSKVLTKVHLLSSDESKLREQLKLILDRTIDSYLKFENKYYIRYRDNINSEELRKIAREFGFSFNLEPELKGGHNLNEILKKRNRLAHGEILFSECGKDCAVEELECFKSDTFEILKIFMKSAQLYIEKGNFLDQNEVDDK